MGFQDNISVDVRGAAHIAPCTYKTIVLKQNVTKENLNVLTQAMFDEYNINTKFVIKWDYVLKTDIIIPNNCILEFDGGSISGTYTITGQNTGIEAGLIKILNTDITLAGTWNVAEAYPEWFGAKGDGVTDDTLPIQKTLDVFKNIFFVSSTYAQAQVYPKSNSTITFSEACHIKVSRALIDTTPGVLAESMISIHSVNNLSIIGNNAIIDMRREDFPSEESGESRHCVRIKDSTNIYIENIHANNSFGDGFCLAFPNSINNKNIKLVNCSADNNRRQGLSIVDGENIYVENCIFSNTHGAEHGPWAGIDIEPNEYAGYKINNIYITNCISKSNNGPGLLIVPSLQVDANNKNVNIIVNNFTSIGDSVGISLQNFLLSSCNGGITINNVNVFGGRFLLVGNWGGNEKFKTLITNSIFVKTITYSTDTPLENSVILVNNSATITDYIGEIYIDNLQISKDVDQKPNRILYILPADGHNDIPMKNFHISDVDVSGITYLDSYGTVFAGRNYTAYDNVSISYNNPMYVSGLASTALPLQSEYGLIDGGTFDLTNKFSKMKKHIVKFKYISEQAVGDVTFTIDSNTKIFDQDGTALTSLKIKDGEGGEAGARKKKLNEYISFCAKDDGWQIYEISKGLERFIEKS